MITAYDPEVSILIPGFMEADELVWLNETASTMETVVEIGCWMGRSTTALASAGRVFSVDHFRGSPSELEGAHAEATQADIYSVAVENLSSYGNIEILSMDSLAASRRFSTASIDMIFLDGEHTREAVLIDLIAWHPKCRRLICGHDRDWEGVISAISIYGIPIEIGPGSIWYMEMLI